MSVSKSDNLGQKIIVSVDNKNDFLGKFKISDN